jgi:hypothetical protein
MMTGSKLNIPAILVLCIALAAYTRPGAANNGTVSLFADTLKTDSETGLAIDENLVLVKAQCTQCHSSKLITQNHFTRDGWKQKIRWMQANHNLWDLGETEKPVLDYLEKHYAPIARQARRAPLKNIQWYKLEEK